MIRRAASATHSNSGESVVGATKLLHPVCPRGGRWGFRLGRLAETRQESFLAILTEGAPPSIVHPNLYD